jgi:hypothetical protein
MATRFAGERAYTIHLPRTIDPLDVIDLSDPDSPRLTDILEIPGWVEHMEVYGYSIIAIGVDDTGEQGWKVAVSLFDTTDPENAVLQDRVVIGEGPTYSDANWDPKSLTILEDRGLIVVPYSSYDWSRYDGQEYGIQFVEVDLDEGDLEVRGKAETSSPVQRTREVNGNMIATGDVNLYSVDISDLGTPSVDAELELASNIMDAYIRGEHLVTVAGAYWDGGVNSYKVSERASGDELLKMEFDDLDFTSIHRSGDDLYVKGIVQGGQEERPMSSITRYSLSDPLSPVDLGTALVDIPDPFIDTGYWKYIEYD